LQHGRNFAQFGKQRGAIDRRLAKPARSAS
jgi:hypothetical protein